MRPRIDGHVARTVNLLQGDDETYSEAISRLLSAEPDPSRLEATITDRDTDAIEIDAFAGTIRKRIRGDGEDALRQRMDDLDATASEALASVFDVRTILVAEMNVLAAHLGRTPRARDVSDADSDALGIGNIQDEFGTFNNALASAGFEPNEEKIGPFERDELVADLREFADDLGHEPTATEMTERGPHSMSTYYNHFGGLTRAKKVAGLRDLDINDIVYLSIAADVIGPATKDHIAKRASETFGREVSDADDKIELLRMAGLIEEIDDDEQEAGYVVTDDGHEELASSEWSQALAETAP